MKASLRSPSAENIESTGVTHDLEGAWLFETDSVRSPPGDKQIAFSASPVATVLCNLAGEIIQVNQALRDLLDVDPRMPIESVDIAALCAGKMTLNFIDALARDGITRQMELEIPASSSKKKAFKVLCTANRVNADEQMACWLIITFTRIVDAQANRWASVDVTTVESELEKLAGIGYWRLDLEANEDCLDCNMDWSSGMFSLLNCKPTRSPRTFRHWLNRVAPADRKALIDAMRSLTSQGDESVIEYRVVANRDQPNTILSRATKIDVAGYAGHQVLIGVEQHKNKSCVERQESSTACLLQAIVENSESPIFAIDSGFRMVCSNDAFRAFLGRHAANQRVNLESFTSCLPDPSQRQRVAENLRRALMGEIRIEAAEVYLAGAGQHRYDFTYTPVRAAAGEVIGVAVQGMDVTARRSMTLATSARHSR